LQKSQRQKSLTDAIRELKLQTIRLLLEQDWKCPNAVQSFLDLASDEYLDIVVFVDSSMDIDSDVDFHLRLMSPNVLYTPYVEYGGGTRNYQTGLDELIEREYRRFCISANFGSDSIPAWWQQAIGNDEKSKDGPDITYEDGSTTSTIEVESALLYIALNQALERRDFPRAKELSSELSRLHTPKEVVV
jgi:hypothetical protein